MNTIPLHVLIDVRDALRAALNDSDADMQTRKECAKASGVLGVYIKLLAHQPVEVTA